MKKLTLLVIACTIFMFLCGKPAPAATMPPDPDLGPSWLMMSFACAVDTATLQERYASTIQVFGWSGDAYVAVDRLEPGKGYFINYDFDIAPIAVCPDGGDGVTQLNLIQGWNLIGNPLDQAVAFNEFQAPDGSVPFVKVFSLVNNTFVTLSLDQNAQPGVAYWVYVPAAVSVEIIDKFQWTNVRITPQNSYSYRGLPSSCLKTEEFIDGNFYPLSRPTQFRATAKTGADFSAQTQDVTDQVQWNSLNPDVATVHNGLLKPLSAGWVTLEVSIKGATKTNLKIFIFDDTKAICLSITPGGEVDIAPLETLAMQVFSYTIDYESCNKNNVCQSKVEEQTEQVEWRMDNSDAGTMKSNIFSAGKAEATVRIHAKLNRIKSNSVVINVRSINISSLYMSISGLNTLPYDCRIGGTSSSYSMRTGSKQPITVTGMRQSPNTYYDYYYYDNNYYYNYADGYSGSSIQTYDLSNSSKYTISDPSVAEVVNGTLHAIKPGTVTISASYGAFNTNSYTINIIDDGTPICLKLNPESGATIPPQGAVTLSVTAIFQKGDANCESANSSTGYCSANVTNKVKWSLSDPSYLTITGNNAVAGKYLGTVKVSATFLGMPSNTIPIEVKKVAWMIVYATLNAPILPNCPYQGTYAACYATSPAKTHKLTVMAQQDSSLWTGSQNVTAMTKWEVSDTSVAEIDSSGNLKAKSQGLIWIRANVGDARSDKIWLVVNDQSGYEFLIVGPAYNYGIKPLKPLQVGYDMQLKAVHYKYTPGSGSNGCYYSSSYNCSSNYTNTDVTDKVQWIVSDNTLGSISQSSSNCSNSYYSYNSYCPAYTTFKGTSPGLADISAQYNSIKSNSFTIDVWNFQNISYCDRNHINMGDWSDAYSQAELETDCNIYSRGEPVTLRYSAYIKDRIYLDNCLDMYVMDNQDNIVCTLREQGCTSEDIGRVSAKSATPVYQYVDTCDMKDKSGNPVPAGTYFAVARFYIMWEPVIRLPFQVVE